MATVAITVAAGGNAGAQFRKLAKQIEVAASALADTNSTGASAVLTIDDAPSAGAASVILSGAGLGTQTKYYV